MQVWWTRIHRELLEVVCSLREAYVRSQDAFNSCFLSMPNEDGIILGGKTIRGFNENTMRGYPLRLTLHCSQHVR